MKNKNSLLLILPLLPLAVASCLPIPSPPKEVVNTPQSFSISTYKEFIPVGQNIPLNLSPDSSLEKWITLVAGDKVLIRVDTDTVGIAVVDNQGYSVVGENGRLIERERERAIFTAESDGIYGIIMTNQDSSENVFTLSTQEITR